jgi:hypothetical protein
MIDHVAFTPTKDTERLEPACQCHVRSLLPGNEYVPATAPSCLPCCLRGIRKRQNNTKILPSLICADVKCCLAIHAPVSSRYQCGGAALR